MQIRIARLGKAALGNKEANKMELKNKKHITLISLVLTTCLILFVAVRFTINNYWVTKATIKQEKEEWITILTHGAFGTFLGMLNFFDVVQGNITGTKYKGQFNN